MTEICDDRNNLPCLHVCLSVLLAYGVVELESFEACTSHEEEGDVLNVFGLLLVCVLFVYEEHVSSVTLKMMSG